MTTSTNGETIELDPASPTIFVTTQQLWTDADLLVFGVQPLKPGQGTPSVTELRVYESDTANDAIPMGQAGALKYKAITFSITATDLSVAQSMTVQFSRDEDTPKDGSPRPVYKTFSLTRDANTAPTVTKTYAITSKTHGT